MAARILLAVHRFAEPLRGGTELYTLHLAQGLRRRGHDVEVLSHEAGTGAGITLTEAVVGDLRVHRVSFDPALADNPMRDEYDNPRVAACLAELYARHRPDLVHATHLGNLSTVVFLVAEEVGIPRVATLTDLWAICPNGQLLRADGTLCTGPTDVGACLHCITHMGPRGARYARMVERMPRGVWRLAAAAARVSPWTPVRQVGWLRALAVRRDVVRGRLLRAQGLLCPGRFVREMLVRNAYPDEAIALSPHGIREPHRLRRSTPPAQGGVLRFGYLGPLQPHKGAHLPAEALALLRGRRDVTLTYWGATGTAPYATGLLRRLGELEGASHRGSYAQAELVNVLNAIDVLIVPSVWYENTPTVIYEALASGTPVIATDLGGMRELVREYGGGWLFPRGDAAALAALMARLADEPELVRERAGEIRPVPAFAEHIAQVAAIHQHILEGKDS